MMDSLPGVGSDLRVDVASAACPGTEHGQDDGTANFCQLITDTVIPE